MSDNRMKDRVKVLLNGTAPESETSEHALVAPPQAHPNQALQVLTLAQRTAEEHVARAHHQADKIRTDALAAADQIARDAQVHAHNVRREADKVLAEARAAADQIARESHAQTAEARRTADTIVAEARGASKQIGMDAKANADHLNLQARQRYDDVVGSLGTKREALQQQIEALEQFDREYRARLQTFMQGQLRALWVDEPQVTADLVEAGAEPQSTAQQLGAADRPVAGPVSGAPRHGADAELDPVPAQRHSPEDDASDGDEHDDK